MDREQAAPSMDLGSHRGYYSRAYREVGDEVTVHDVAMDDLDARVHDSGYLVAQVSEIRGEDGREKV
jgi:hypothetical protein